MRPAHRCHLPPAFLAVFGLACAAPQTDQALGPAEFLVEHYANLRPGADWDAVRRDFSADATITRNNREAPGTLLIDTTDNFFGQMGPAIDSMNSFVIEPLAMDVTVYDRIASGWVHVHVTSEAADGTPNEFYAVDLMTLFLDENERWAITHLLYQHDAEDWPAYDGHTMRAFTSGATRTDMRVGMVYH